MSVFDTLTEGAKEKAVEAAVAAEGAILDRLPILKTLLEGDPVQLDFSIRIQLKKGV